MEINKDNNKSNEPKKNKRRSSWLSEHARFTKNLIIAGFIAITAQTGFKDVEEFRRDDFSKAQTEEMAEIHEELKEMEAQLANLKQTEDTAVTTRNVVMPVKKDTVGTSFK